MDFDRSKHNVIKYLPTNNDENIWGMSISGIGFQSIDPKGSYPLKGHPIGYTFNPDRGRIIDEFALVYIVKGEGTFTSINCFEKKISKGDAFFIFPGQWHSYQPIANIGWDEYYVTFQGDYFEKLLEEIREIRLSERRFYQKVTDIYATSIDYDSKSPISIEFFKKVQNKMHYAISRKTAAEIIYDRVNSEDFLEKFS